MVEVAANSRRRDDDDDDDEAMAVESMMMMVVVVDVDVGEEGVGRERENLDFRVWAFSAAAAGCRCSLLCFSFVWKV